MRLLQGTRAVAICRSLAALIALRVIRRALLSIAVTAALGSAVTASPAAAQQITVLVTSDYGAAQIRNTLTAIFLTLRQVAPNHFLSSTTVTGDIAFWDELEKAEAWITADTWQNSNPVLGSRRDPSLLCIFQKDARQIARCTDTRKEASASSYVMPGNIRVVPVATTRVVRQPGQLDAKTLSDKAKTEMCSVNVGWETVKAPFEKCFVRVVPTRGGPYENARICANGVQCSDPLTEILLRVTSYSVVITPPDDHALRARILSELTKLNERTLDARLTIFAKTATAINRSPPKTDTCVPAEIAFDDPVKDDWRLFRSQLGLQSVLAAFPAEAITNPQVTIVEGNYDSQCGPADPADWQSNRCAKEEDILRQHPFLLGQKMIAVASGGPNQCLGAAAAVDHSVSVAGALAGGDLESGRFTILPGPFVEHSRTRLGGSTTALFPYIPVQPVEAIGSPMVWLMPVEIDRSKAKTKTIKEMLNDNFGSKIQHKKRTGVVFVAAPTDRLCSDNQTEVNWQVQAATTDCKCYPSCLGRVDAAVVVAPLTQDGRLMEKSTAGETYLIGPGNVHVAAPGEDVITSSFSGDKPILRYRSGASVATGVAGAAATLYWRGAEADANLVFGRILATADLNKPALRNRVRFGALNLTRLMLPVSAEIDRAIARNRKKVVSQEATADETADARRPVTMIEVDFSKGYSNAELKARGKKPACALEGDEGHLWLSEDAAGVRATICPKLKDLLRLRVTSNDKGEIVVTAVFWDQKGVDYTPVRIVRDWYLHGCDVLGPDAPESAIPCLAQRVNGKPVPVEIRNRDFIFPNWVY